MSKKKSKIQGHNFRSPITRLEFAQTHYFNEQYDTDFFYVGIANDILKLLNNRLKDQEIPTYATRKRTAITIAAHLEDLISGSHIWDAFLSLYQKMYNRPFPFYDVTEDPTYQLKGIPSMSSLRFLLWYEFNNAEPDIFLNPKNPFIELFASEIGMIITSKEEEIPESYFRPCIRSEKESDLPAIYQIRHLCQWLTSNCYLTRAHDYRSLFEDAQEMFNPIFDSMNQKDPEKLLYSISTYIPFNTKIGPLALYPYEWLAEIIALEPLPSEKKYIKILREFKSQPVDFYQLKKVNKKSALLETVSGHEINLSAETFKDGIIPDFYTAQSTMETSLIYYDKAWGINGIAICPLPAELFGKIKQAYTYNQQYQQSNYDYYFKKLGKRIGVAKDYQSLVRLIPELENASTPHQHELNIDPSYLKDAKYILYFLNNDGNLTLIPDLGVALKIDDNPYYDPKLARSRGIMLLLNTELADQEFRNYIVEHNLIPEAAINSTESSEAGLRILQENIGFISRLPMRDTLNFSPALSSL